MADAPRILDTDYLDEAYPKLNKAIDNSNEALSNANIAKANADNAVSTANMAETKADSVQSQFNQVVIEGDSSVEAAQARVAADGSTFTTLKERLDKADSIVAKKSTQRYVDVRDYWVNGYSNWKPAIDSALSQFTTEGGTLFFPPQYTYQVDDTVIINKPYVTITSLGKSYLKGSRILTTQNVPIFKVLAQGVTVEGLVLLNDTLTGADGTLQINNTTSIVEVGDATTNYDDVKILNNVLRGGYYGLKFWSMNGRIENNLFSSNHIHLHLPFTASYEQRGRSITNNTMHSGGKAADGTESWAIVADKGNFFDKITLNRIDGSWFQGGIKYLGYRAQIALNHFRYNRGYADILVGGYHNMVAENTSTNSYGHGIVNIGNKNKIKSNIIVNAQKHGVYANPTHADAESNVNLVQYEDNYVEGCGADGTNTYDGFNLVGTNCKLMGNTIYNNNRYGLRLESGASALMMGENFIDGNVTGQLSNAAGSNGIKYISRNEYGTSVPPLDDVTMKLINADTTNGVKIGNAATQKVAFYGSTPLAKQSGVAKDVTSIWNALNNLGLIQ